MKMFGIVLAFAAGMLLPLQSLINARLGQLTAGPLFAALCSFTVGTVALAACWAATRPGMSASTLLAPPWWAWTGGLIGAGFVFIGTLLVVRLGAAGMISLFVLGQLAGSVLVDHFGILHVRTPVDPIRIGGLVLIAIGALLVLRPWRIG